MTALPVTLLPLMHRERSRQQPLPQDGGFAVASLNNVSLGKSPMATPVMKSKELVSAAARATFAGPCCAPAASSAS